MSRVMQWEVVDENEGVVVHISEAGRKRLSDECLRRAANDNALHVAACKRRELLHGIACWLAVIALGVFMGWQAAGGFAS